VILNYTGLFLRLNKDEENGGIRKSDKDALPTILQRDLADHMIVFLDVLVDINRIGMEMEMKEREEIRQRRRNAKMKHDQKQEEDVVN